MRYLFLPLLMLITAALAYFALINYPDSDPRYSLLSAQALLEHGSAELTPYQTVFEGTRHYQLYYAEDGRLYYAYPPGPSLFSLPFVAVARARGLDMAVLEDDAAVQKVLAILTSVVVVALLYALARTHLPPAPSAGLTAVFMWGTVLITTLGTAYWSLNLVVLFETAALILLMRLGQADPPRWASYALGLCLFGAYLCRPTAAVAIAPIVAYVWLVHRPYFWRMAVIAGGGVVLLAAVSWWVYALPLPPYYLPLRWGGLQGFGESIRRETSTPLLMALYGLLLSPSRGLLIFSPMLGAVLVAVVGQIRPLWARPLVRLLFVWVALHLLMVVRFHGWWGGFTFGSRLLTDMIPPLFLLTVLVWPTAATSPNRWLPLPFALLAIPALFIHSYAGLFNVHTMYWNGTPRPFVTPRMMFDWRTPQFLATSEAICDRSLRYHREAVLTFGEIALSSPHQPITPATADINQWIGHYSWVGAVKERPSVPPSGAHKAYLPMVGMEVINGLWAGFSTGGESLCVESHILFTSPHWPPPEWQATHELTITAISVGEPQVVDVLLNGRYLGSILPNNQLPQRWVIPISLAWFEQELNQLTFRQTAPSYPQEVGHPLRRTTRVEAVMLK